MYFLFLGLIRCISSPRLLYLPYLFRQEWYRMTGTGLPHSEIPGSKVVCTSPRLFAAYHVFHRLHVPRHPPYALSSFTKVSFLFMCYQHHFQIVKKRVKKICGASRDRTDDLLVANQALSQLSYSPSFKRGFPQVGLRGLEPRTSSLSGMRSNHLSYKPLSSEVKLNPFYI